MEITQQIKLENHLIRKYGKAVTNQLLTKNHEVLRNCIAKKDDNTYQHKIKSLLSLKDALGNNLVPELLIKEKVEWGVDFSSWIGQFDAGKEYFFIGAEPHINRDFQLVYDFGNIENKDVNEIAREHFSDESDIWNYLTKIFVDDLSDENITDFLKKCYITDLCHLVPKKCGQVKDIVKALSIKPKDWNEFRTKMANEFLIEEIKIVNPKFVILHGNVARKFFKNQLKVIFNKTFEIENSSLKILSGEYDGYKIISIPHLKGQNRSNLWKSKKYPERPKSARKIIRSIIQKTN